MNILLVNPSPAASGINLVDSLQARSNLTVAIELLHLSALTPSDIAVEVSDAHADMLALENVDLVYATGQTCQAAALYRIARRCREIGLPVVLGGAHVSALPEEAEGVANSIILGESESVWPDILQDFTEGHLKNVYQPKVPMALDSLSDHLTNFLQATPASFQHKKYPTLLTRPGFADTPATHATVRAKSIDAVIAEIEASGASQVFFKDEDLLSDIPLFQQTLAALQMQDKTWSGDIVLHDDPIDPSLAYAICMSGKGILLKVIPSPDGYTHLINKHMPFIQQLTEKGISPWFSFTVGYDEDPEAVCEEIYTIADQYALKRVTITLLTPAPGSYLFHQLESEGRIINRQWENYHGTQAVFAPKNRSARSLEEHYRALVRRVNRLSFRRMTIALNS